MFILSCGIVVLQNQAVCDIFRNFRVIWRRFAAFLCYSVRCLYEFLFGFVVLVLPYAPLHRNDVMRFEKFDVTSMVDKSMDNYQLDEHIVIIFPEAM